MTIDMLPTIARSPAPSCPTGKIDGKDIWPLLFARTGAKSPHEAYYFYWNNELQASAAASGSCTSRTPIARSTATKPGKDGKPGLYKNVKAGLELFNLDDDLSERIDVAARHPDVVRRLEALADRMRADLGDSLRKKNDGSLGPRRRCGAKQFTFSKRPASLSR